MLRGRQGSDVIIRGLHEGDVGEAVSPQCPYSFSDIIHGRVRLESECAGKNLKVARRQRNRLIDASADDGGRDKRRGGRLGFAEHAEADGDFSNGDHDADNNEDNDDPGDVAHLSRGDGIREDLSEVQKDAATLV